MKIKFGILGYGFMGHIHADMIRELEGAEVTAICDNDPDKLKDALTGIKQYDNMDSLFADENVNTVLISVSNHVHKEAVIKAAKAGKHILCEKPAAMSVKEYDEMLAVVKECGVKFTVHQQRRWDKDFRISKEVYDKKMVGDMYTVQAKLYGFNGNMHDWHVYPEFGGGMLYDWGVHLIDQMLWMVDSKIKTVYADMRNVINQNVDDYFKIILRFENNVTAEIELGTYFLTNKDKWFEKHWFIGGNKGSMFVDGFEPEGQIVRTSKLLENVPGKTTMTAAGPTRSFGPPPEGRIVVEELPKVEAEHKMFFDNFIKAMNGEEEFIVMPEEVRRVLCLMEAVRESAKTCRTVDFE
ncbi:Gfo/Idh/MocA family protein [Konateibacter massiliensis]|uniref:Gfo/Idh/MocA family protein n=1 Tax=Konateibacter massiliensis TaxID=2002841 RepID=UPI000C14643C|nr:Gfo/Idh/MocA family oxidoreductase [Konateibacter massiliensis]